MSGPAIGSLCSGYGGLDLAAEAAFGARTVWHAELNPAASKVLAHRWPGVRNFGDIKLTHWGRAPKVDIITAGYPCQPFSHAGRRNGVEDPRHLWPFVAQAIRGVRPRYVLLENVAGHRSLGFDVVLGDLAAMRYVGSWVSLRASDIGACHGRERVFILARDAESVGRDHAHAAVGRGESARQARGSDLHVADAPGSRRESVHAGTSSSSTCEGREWVTGRGPGRASAPDAVNGSSPAPWGGRLGSGEAERVAIAAPDSASERREERWTEPARVIGGSDAPVRRGPGAGLREVQWGKYGPAIRRHERVLGRLAPAPSELAPKGGQRLAPRFVEWMQMLPEGWVTDVPGLSRDEQLTALGNGVVPPQAVAASRRLLTIGAVA